MKSSHIEVFTRLGQARAVIDALLLRADDARGRAALLAEMLQFLWPGEALAACVLREDGGVWAAALDEAGAPRTEWAALIRDELIWRWAADEGAAPRTPLADALGLTGFRIVLEGVRFRDSVYGTLLLAVPDDESDAEAVRAVLAACARHLALCLAVEALEGEREALAEESATNTRMAEIAEASIPVAHEFNNFLNALLLHTAVLKYQLPESMHQGLADVRQQAMSAAGLIQQFQHYRRRKPAPQSTADLNRAVRAALEALADGEATSPPQQSGVVRATVLSPGGTAGVRVPVRLDLTAGAAAPGTFVDLKRLCVFLIRNAAGAAAEAGGGVTVRTARDEGRVILRVEDAGAMVAPELLPHLFEPGAAGREGTSALELAACKTLARRLQGSLRVENGAEGGAAFVAEWTASGARQSPDSASRFGTDAESGD